MYNTGMAEFDDSELTPESLQDKLSEYRQALEQEFRRDAENEPENIPAKIQGFFKENSVEAAAQIVFLAHNAESETVRSRLLQFIITEGKKDADKDGDPIREILNSLKQKEPSDSTS